MSDDKTKVLSNGDDKLDRIIEMLRQQSLRIESLEEKGDERLKDSRPIWASVQAQITEMREEMQTSFRRVERRLDVVSGDINNLLTDLHDPETPITKLEERS